MMLNEESSKNIAGVERVWKEITNAVKVTPTMVFSVIGDSDSFVPRPWPKTVFQTALIEAAKSGGESWILYSGKNEGVSKVVKDAYQKYENREFGTKLDEIHLDNKNRHIKLINFTDNEAADDKNMEVVINCNSQNEEFGSFLLKFEKFVSEQEVSFFNQKVDLKMPIPTAIIVCEGDIHTIAHTADALQNKLPVIIMKGSGKAADLILDYLEKSTDLRKNAGILFGLKFEETHFQTFVEYLKIIRKYKSLVGVFDLNSDDPLKLSNIVGEAVVSCWSMEKSHLHVHGGKGGEDDSDQQTEGSTKKKTSVTGHHITRSSITWKSLRHNLIRPEESTIYDLLEGQEKKPMSGIVNPKFSSPASLPLYFYFGFQLLQESNLLQKCGHVLLLEALKANRCDYVKVLLDQGVKLKLRNLPELYEQTVSCKECQFEKDDCLHMQWILKQILKTEAHTVCQQYRFAMDKIKEDDTQREKYLKKIMDLEVSVADSAKRLCCRILQYKGINEKKKISTTEENSRNCDTSDILLWSIFANRKDLAEICWIRGKNHLISGLVCSVLLQKLSKKAKNVEENSLCTDLAEHAKMFEQRCINIMDEMYADDAKHAVEAMDDEATIWGVRSSPLTIAYENYMYDVVAHICSRKLLNKKWYNNLAPALKPFCKSAFQKPLQFIAAPLTRYISNYMMFFITLFLFSARVLDLRFYDKDIEKFVGYYFLLWATGDFLEEMICCFGYLGQHSRFHHSHFRRLKRYLYDFWNVLDVISYALLIFAWIYMQTIDFFNEYIIVKRALALSLLFMFLRFLEVFLIHRMLGLTLIMIKEMVKDLLYFLIIILFVILGVGIYYQALLHTDFNDYQNVFGGDWTNWRLWKVVYYPYWQMYTELNLDYLKGCNQSCCPNQTCCSDQDDKQSEWSVLVVAGGYVLFANLLLVNLVIAMFSYTFERVQQNSEKLWWYERYTAVHDYQWRIPPPFNLLFLPYRIWNMLKRKLKSCSQKDIERSNGATERNVRRTLNAKEYRGELQRIIACSIYNKL